MNIEFHHWWSESLHQNMELKTYGQRGKPVVVFPTQGGRFYQFEDFGMVAACGAFIAEGQIMLFALDSIDDQSWANWDAHPAQRALRHNAYDRYVLAEVIPFIENFPGVSGKCLATGCSMGAYHAANFFFRHPEVFDAVIALSGIYRLNMFIGDYIDENVYFNSPLLYLPNLEDQNYLEQFRRSQIIICAGRGAWEDEMVANTEQLGRVLRSKNVPCWIDLWGEDVNHDWPWWRKQLPYFLSHINL